MKDLRQDPLIVRARYCSKAVEQAVVSGVTGHGDDFVISVRKDPKATRAETEPGEVEHVVTS